MDIEQIKTAFNDWLNENSETAFSDDARDAMIRDLSKHTFNAKDYVEEGIKALDDYTLVDAWLDNLNSLTVFTDAALIAIENCDFEKAVVRFIEYVAYSLLCAEENASNV